MLCAVVMVIEFGMNKKGRKIWKGANAKFIYAFLMVYIAREMAKLDHVGCTVLQGTADALISTVAMNCTLWNPDNFPDVMVMDLLHFVKSISLKKGTGSKNQSKIYGIRRSTQL